MESAGSKAVFKNPVMVVCSTVVLFLASQIVGTAVAALASGVIKSETYQLLLIISCSLLVLVAMLTTAMRVLKFSPKAIGWTKPKSKTWWLILPAFIVYFILSGVSLFLAAKYLPGFKADQVQDVGFKQLAQPLQLAAGFISLVVLTPIFEETIFRGVLFKGLRRRLPFWASALLTSVIFAAAHFQWNVSIDVFILSLVLCYLAEKSGSVVPGVVLHALKNAVAFAIIFISK